MDIMAHSMWALVLLPGPLTASKVILGIAPDLSVFATSVFVQIIQKNRTPKFKSRSEMMNWFHKSDNKWVLKLYSWTHSLVIWAIILFPLILIITKLQGNFPWFLLAAPLHILLDIPTHTKDSFPVRFLTPISRFQINGIHWSKTWLIILNYFMITVVFFSRMYFLDERIIFKWF
jgi:hypothetical protein